MPLLSNFPGPLRIAAVPLERAIRPPLLKSAQTEIASVTRVTTVRDWRHCSDELDK